MAGGTVFFARLRTSPVKLKRGMCNLISFLLGMEKPEFCFCMSYLKPNPNPNKTKLAVDVRHSHVKHCSHVEHRFLFSRITGEREALFLMKHCSDVKHNSRDVNLCISVEFCFACLWTHLDRVGLKFMLFCNVLDERHVSRNAMPCTSLRMSGTCHNSHAQFNICGV